MRALSFLLLSGLLAAAGAQAQNTVFDENALRAYLSQQVAASGAPLTRFDVQVLSVDARAALAPCRRTEPFLPSGARLWGRGSVGVRCVDGAGWSVLLPVMVRAWGTGLVAANPLAAGAVVGPQDVREQEVELTREAPTLMRDAGQLQGRTLSRPLAAGQPLRADMFRATQVVQAGDPVRLRVTGVGFALSATGQALAGAAEGQPLRVRTDLGKILSGIAREGRVVDVTL